MREKIFSTTMLMLLIVGTLEIPQMEPSGSQSQQFMPEAFEVLSGTLFIRYIQFDDLSSEPQYDYDETIEVTVEVDTTQSSQNVRLTVVLYDPDSNQWDWDNVPDYTTYGTSDDPQTLYLSTNGNLDLWLNYAGGDRKWRVKVIVADADTKMVEDTEYKYFWGGPRPIRHFTCKDYLNPDETRTTTFYDIDEKAYEYTEWDTHGLYITYTVTFKWHGTMGLYKVSDKDLSPELSFVAVWDLIEIRLNSPGFNSGSWYVEYYLDSSYRSRDDFAIEYTGELAYINVPFHFQEEEYYCGPAAIEMVFDFYGEDISQTEIADVARTTSDDGTYQDDMRRTSHFSNLSFSVGNELPGSIIGYSARKLGYTAFEKAPITIEDLKNLIDLGYPIIVLMNYSFLSPSLHYRVVVGYDNHNDEIIFHDPWNKPAWGDIYGGPNISMNYTLFLNLWEFSNYWGLFVSPWEAMLTSHLISKNQSMISVDIKYPCPPPFNASQYPASSCNATIFLPEKVILAEGETIKKVFADLSAGSTVTINWTLKADTPGYYDILVEVEGKISGSVSAHGTYPSYNYIDRIGCIQQETVNIGIKTLVVPDNYPTIQEAINHADEGDTIFVRAGTYYEHVVVNKSLTLVGENTSTTIIYGNGEGTCFDLCPNYSQTYAAKINITGFTITNFEYGILGEYYDRILLYCSISENSIENCTCGIYLYYEASLPYCSISRNTIHDCASGVMLDSCFNSVISENDIHDVDSGISIHACYNNTIRNNRIRNCTVGISMHYIGATTFSNSVEKNNITDCYIGLLLGTWIEDVAENNQILGNLISANTIGIWLGSGENNTIATNFVLNNSIGIRLEPLSEFAPITGNHIYHNIFDNNTLQVFVIPWNGGYPTDNVWDDGYPSGGNYWSDYTATDDYCGPYQNETSSDGIRDTPYVIDTYNRDNYPLVHPYGSVRNLDTNLTYLTIQSAINAPETLNGQTIFVKNGTYYEHVVINKSISLVGEDWETTIIDGNFAGNVVEVTASNITLTGFTIRNSAQWEELPFGGIILSHVENCRISENSILNNDYGIWLYESSNCSITENNITDNNLCAIELRFSSNTTILRNNIAENHYGIELYEFSNCNYITGNNIATNTHGIVVQFSSNDNSISGNNITANSQGIIISDFSTYNDIIRNNIAANNYEGIILTDSANYNTISVNNIVANGYYGLALLHDSNFNTIAENVIADNVRAGITFQGGGCVNNSFYHNNFVNNTEHVLMLTLGHVNFWHNGYPCGGNYWSDYVGTDEYSGPYQNETGSDGIGDTPYIIDENNRDEYPLMGPFGGLTIEGENSTVFPSNDVCIIFENITFSGLTTVNRTESGPEVPYGFKLAGQYYDITTTANYTGRIKIRIIYNDSNITQEEEIALQLKQWNETSQQWNDITTHLDIENNVIYGETVHLSMLAVLTPTIFIHDITIINIKFSTPSPTVNETVTIHTTIKNNGYFIETFNLSLNYTLILDPLIGAQTITLAPGESIQLNFTWIPNATGRYEIKAYTSTIPNDINPEDNTKIIYLHVASGSRRGGGGGRWALLL